MGEELQEYIEKMTQSRNDGFKICKTRNLNAVGLGFRRSLHDKPIPCMVVASFTCWGGGGYIVRTLPGNKIMQVQSFKKRKEKRSVFNTQGNKKVS